jgi:hypothetical protein
MSSAWRQLALFGGDPGLNPVIGAQLQEFLRHNE